LLIGLCFGSVDRSASGDTKLPEPPVPDALRELADGRAPPAPLVVSYSDLHGLWGGLELTVHGDGKVEQRAVRVPVGEPRTVSPDELRQLARLLVAEKVWEQRVPERAPVPDESRAYLAVRYGARQVAIWEWYNDLVKNQRIAVIVERMKQIAWKAAPRK
jgi:hypothetical protein